MRTSRTVACCGALGGVELEASANRAFQHASGAAASRGIGQADFPWLGIAIPYFLLFYFVNAYRQQAPKRQGTKRVPRRQYRSLLWACVRTQTNDTVETT